jgi:hypothetical protein
MTPPRRCSARPPTQGRGIMKIVRTTRRPPPIRLRHRSLGACSKITFSHTPRPPAVSHSFRGKSRPPRHADPAVAPRTCIFRARRAHRQVAVELDTPAPHLPTDSKVIPDSLVRRPGTPFRVVVRHDRYSTEDGFGVLEDFCGPRPRGRGNPERTSEPRY